MKKLNTVIYQKLLLQAKEAEFLGMEKLSSAVVEGIGSYARDNSEFFYSESELKEDVYKGLWKLAFNVVNYHDLESVDVEKLDAVIALACNSFIKEIEKTVEKLNEIGPNEPKLVGEK